MSFFPVAPPRCSRYNDAKPLADPSRAERISDEIVTRGTRVFLVGPMGAGKTTIGSQLARSLSYEFVDLDQELERRTGASVTLIFDVEGEEGFRAREAKLLEELTQRECLVLATGGGAVLDPDNRRFLTERGFVVYLRTPLEKLVERTRFDTSRPLLRTDDPAATLGAILEAREPLYNEVADVVLDTGKLSVKQTVKRIIESVE